MSQKTFIRFIDSVPRLAVFVSKACASAVWAAAALRAAARATVLCAGESLTVCPLHSQDALQATNRLFGCLLKTALLNCRVRKEG